MPQSVGIGLDPQSIKTLVSAIDILSKAIDNLGTQLTQVQKNANVFKTAFGDKKTFASFLDSMKSIDKETDRAVRSIAALIRAFAQLEDVTKNLAAVPEIPKSIALFIDELSKTKLSTSGVLIKQLEGLQKLFASLAALGRIDIKRITGLTIILPIMLTVITLVSRITGLINTLTFPVSVGNFVLFTELSKFAKALVELSKSIPTNFVSIVSRLIGFGIVVPILQIILTVSQKITGLINTITFPLETKSKAFFDNFRAFALGLKNLGTALSGDFKFSGGFLTDLGKGVLSFVTTLGNLVKFGVVIPAIFAVLTITFKGIAALSQLIPGDDALTKITTAIFKVGEAFKNISSALAGLPKQAEFKAKTAVGSFALGLIQGLFGILGVAGQVVKIGIVFPIVFTVLTGVFKLIGVLSSVIPGQDAFDKLAKSFLQISQAFNNLSEAFGKQGIVQSLLAVVKLGIIFPVIFTTLAVIMRGVGIVISLLPGGNALDQFADTILAISKAFKNLSELNVDAGGLKKLTKPLDIFSKLIQTLVKTFKGIGDVRLTGVADIFNSLAKIFTSFDKLSSLSQGQSGQFIDTLKKIISGLSGLLKSIGKLNTRGIDKVGLTLLHLSELLEKLTKGSVNTQNFIQFTVDLETGFNNLRNINIPTKATKTLDQVIKVFSKFDKIGDPKSLSSLVSSIVKFITQIGKLDSPAKAAKQIPPIFTALANGLNKLKGVTVGKNTADTIKNIALALKELTKIQLKGADIVSPQTLNEAETKGGDLAGAVEQGFLSANLRVSIVKFFADIFKEINPFALVGKFTDLKNQTITALREIGDKLRDLGQQLRDFGTNLINTVGFGGILRSQAFQGTVAFENTINQLKVFGNLTEDQLVTAQAFAEQIGIDYPLSSAEAAAALLDLSRAGLELNETFDVLPNAADLAVFTSSNDIRLASRAIISATQVFDQFSESVEGTFENTSEAADIFVRVANATTAEVDDLIAGLDNVGPAANSFGLSLEETVSILGIFNDAGIRGAEAGTALRSTLNALQSDRAQDELRRLGISLFDTQGNMRSFNDILTDLNESLFETRTVTVRVNNITAEQRAQLDAAQRAYARAQQQLFLYNEGLTRGSLDAESAAEAIAEYTAISQNAQNTIAEITGSQETAATVTRELTASQQEANQSLVRLADTFGRQGLLILLEQGEDGLAQFIAEMQGLPGAAEQAQLLMASFSGTVEQLKGSLETLKDRVLLPLIERAFQPMAEFLLFLVNGFLEMPPAFSQVLSTGILLVSTFATLVGSISVATGVVLEFGGALTIVLSTIARFVLTKGLLAGAAVSFTASLAAFVVTATLVTAVLTTLSVLVESVFTVIKENTAGAGDAFTRFSRTFENVFAAFLRTARAVGSAISALFGVGDGQDQLLSFGRIVRTVFASITPIISAFAFNINQVAEVLEGFAQIVSLRGNLQSFADLEDINRIADNLSHNPLIRAILGENVTGGQIRAIFEGILTAANELKTAFSGLGNAFEVLAEHGFNEEALRGISTQLSNVAVEFFEFLETVTGKDFDRFIEGFLGGDFGAGLQNVIQELLSSAVDLILDNEDLIRNALTSLFNFALPGKFVVTILRVLGLDQLADGVQGIFDLVVDIFNRGLGVLFDLARGQSFSDAFFGNFGQQARPFFRILSGVGRIITNIIGIFQDLFSILFPSIPGASGGTNFLEFFFEGVADGVETFSGIISALRVTIREVATVVANVVRSTISFIGLLISPVTSFFTDLFSGNIDSFPELAERLGLALRDTFLNLVLALPALIGQGLTNLGQLFGIPFFNTMADQVTQEDYAGAISTLAGGILGVVTDAISQVPALLIGLGETLGIPLFEEIGTNLQEGDFSEATAKIASGIGKVIQDAVESVPQGLIDIGQAAGLELLIDLGQQIEGSTLLDNIAAGLGQIATYPLEIISAVFEGIGSVARFVQEAEPAKLVAISAFFGAIGLLFAAKNITAVTQALSLFFANTKSFVLTSVVPFAAFVAGLLLFKNILEELDTLLTGGSLSTFFGDVLAGMASDLLGFLGIEFSAEDISNNIRVLFGSIGLVIDLSIRTALDKIADGIRAAFASFETAFNEAKARAQLLVNGNDVFGQEFFAVSNALDAGGGQGAAFFRSINDALVGAVDPKSLTSQLVERYGVVLDNFTAAITSETPLSAEDYAAIANTIVSSGQLGDALLLASQTNGGAAMGAFLQGLLTVDPAVFATIDFEDFGFQLANAIATGAISEDAANDIINQLLVGGRISPEAAQTLRDEIAGALGEFGTGSQEALLVPVTGEITNVVVPENDDPPSVPVTGEITTDDEVIIPEGTTPPSLPVTPVIDPDAPLLPEGSEPPTVPVTGELANDELLNANVATTEDAEEFRLALQGVQTQADTTRTSVNDLVNAVVNYNLSLLINLTAATLQWSAHAFLVNPLLTAIKDNVAGITDNLVEMSTELETQTPLIIENLVLMQDAFVVFANTVEPAIDRIVQQIRTLTTAIGLYGLALINSGLAPDLPPNNQPTNQGGGARGRAVQPGSLYEVSEPFGSVAELLQIGNKMYLLPGQGGEIIPAQAAGLGTPPPQVNNNNSTSMGNVTIQASPIQISVVQQPGQDATQLANQVGQQVQNAQQQNLLDVTRQLKLSGRPT